MDKHFKHFFNIQHFNEVKHFILGSTEYLREVAFIFHFILGSPECLKSRLHWPFYFGEHCLFMRKINSPWTLTCIMFRRHFWNVPFLVGMYWAQGPRESLLYTINQITFKIIKLFRYFWVHVMLKKNDKLQYLQKSLIFSKI